MHSHGLEVRSPKRVSLSWNQGACWTCFLWKLQGIIFSLPFPDSRAASLGFLASLPLPHLRSQYLIIFIKKKKNQSITDLWSCVIFRSAAKCISCTYSYCFVLVSLLSCVQLFCNPMDSSPLGFSVYGTCQARTLEWVAVSFSMHTHSSSVAYRPLQSVETSSLCYSWVLVSYPFYI